MVTAGLDKDNVLGTVESKIRSIVESMDEDVEYMFANWAQANGNLTYRVLYDYLDVNVTGIVIEPTLIEVKGISICSDEIIRK